ncbi:MAG: twin-arginine translocase subunit TatC [Verrucomicrobiales bacterium]|nr:twin-arginine translocase subunit TatC [Verrucomicrobiales bacterium]
MLKTAFEKLFKMRESAARMRPGADEGYDAHEKPFLDHLEDLRHTLMKILGTLGIATFACFAFHRQIFELIQMPAKMPLARVSDGVSLWERLDLITLSPPEFIVLMLKLSFFSGIIVTFPFLLFFMFQFILPGLRQVEKKAIIPGAGVGFILFLTGACFAFFLAAPVALKFFFVFENERISNLDPTKQAMEKSIAEFSLVGMDGEIIKPLKKGGQESDGEVAKEEASGEGVPEGKEAEKVKEKDPVSPETAAIREEIRNTIRETFATVEASNMAFRYDDSRDKLVLVEVKGGKSVYRIGEYVTFIARLVLVFGVSFQLPVVVTILVKLELLTARVMRATRSYAWIIILVSAAILTPPDLLTLGMLGGPMILLYEICIIIATFIERGREKKQLAEEEARRSRMEQLYSKSPDDLTEQEKEEIHRAEIEQYEREHAHLYDGEHGHDDPHHGSDGTVSRDSLHGDEYHDPYHDYDPHHDESWHEDEHHQWHDGHPDDPNFHEHDEHGNLIEKDKGGEEKPESGDGMESDHAEPEDLSPADGEGNQDENVFHDDEACEPSGPVVDVNHASKEELETLVGVGPVLAQAIIDHRPFETFDDLEAVPGLGPDKLNAMIDRLMIG